jgi:prophage tail gpP-like protein
VKSPKFGIDADMLIVEAAYVIDDTEGTLTELTVVPKDSYMPEPIITNAAPWESLR